MILDNGIEDAIQTDWKRLVEGGLCARRSIRSSCTEDVLDVRGVFTPRTSRNRAVWRWAIAHRSFSLDTATTTFYHFLFPNIKLMRRTLLILHRDLSPIRTKCCVPPAFPTIIDKEYLPNLEYLAHLFRMMYVSSSSNSLGNRFARNVDYFVVRLAFTAHNSRGYHRI